MGSNSSLIHGTIPKPDGSLSQVLASMLVNGMAVASPVAAAERAEVTVLPGQGIGRLDHCNRNRRIRSGTRRRKTRSGLHLQVSGRHHPSRPLEAHGPVADLPEVAAVTLVEQEHPAHGAHPSRSAIRSPHAVQRRPSSLRNVLARRTRHRHSLQVYKRSKSVPSFVTATHTR